MGTLRELNSLDKNVHMLLTNSSLAEIYVYDTLRKRCGSTRESIYEVNNSKEFKVMLELCGLQPMQSDRWLFIVDYSKVGRLLEKDRGILESESSCYLVKVNKYKDYLAFKEMYSGVNDLYLSMIRMNEVSYLLNGYGLSPKIVDFVAKSYMRDPEKVFLLKKEIDMGYEVTSNRDVVKICGASSGSINNFAMSLLKEFPKTEKGFKTVCRNRVKLAKELADVYGYSTFKNFLMVTVKDLLQIKMLYLEGNIYESIRELPECVDDNGKSCFDEKKLSKYGMYLRYIKEDIPYSRLVNLYISLRGSERWRSELDILLFLYKYYGGCWNAVIG